MVLCILLLLCTFANERTGRCTSGVVAERESQAMSD